MAVMKDNSGNVVFIGPGAEDLEHVLRDRKAVAESRSGASPNEVAAGLAEPDVAITEPNPEHQRAEHRSEAIEKLADALLKKVK